MTRRISNKAMLDAIKGSGGIVSTIATRLGLSWSTARLKIDADPDLSQAYIDECERVLDMAEGTIIKSITAGDTQDAKWLLSRKGKRRGYGDNVDVTSGGEKITEIGVRLIDYRTGITETENRPASDRDTPSQDESPGDGA